MKFFVTLMLVTVVVAVALPFTVLKGKDGAPLMTLDKVKMPSLPTLPDIDLSLPSSDSSKSDTVYKWQDSQGVWQFSTTPPPQGTQYSTQVYNPAANQVQAFEAPKPEPETQPQQATGVPSLSDAYNPQNIQKLMQNAQQIQNTLNERAQQQQQLLEQQQQQF